jgi:hypothetical protein
VDLSAACDLTQPCAMQTVKAMVVSYLELGPVAWLSLLITLVVFRKVFGFIAFILFPNRKDRS